jgi:uncharacterized protein YbaR (Trm112 family)
MFLPLVDVLRCPVVHEETWLVASIDRAEDRDIITGALGCPQCLAEYPIRDGIVDFGGVERLPDYRAPDEGDAMRLAAALDLTDARMTAVLQGAWACQAPLIRGFSPAALLLLNAPEGIATGDGLSLVRAGRAPLASASMNAAAFDADATPEMIASLVRALKPSGRLLGPVSVAVPDGATELVRDDEVWVAQAGAATTSAPIALIRKPSPRAR